MRYVDWFFTTPFFLLDLALLSGADTWDTFYVMLMNAVCIGCGAIGALVESCRYSMFILGMVTFVMFNQKLFGAMMSKASAMGSDVSGKYRDPPTPTLSEDSHGDQIAGPFLILLVARIPGALFW